MKKYILIISVIFVVLLTGCQSATAAFDFQTYSDGTIEIRQLSSELSLTTVGQMTYGEPDIVLSERGLNGNSTSTDGGYRYSVSDSIPGLEQAYPLYSETAEIQGILLYHGLGYLVIEQDDVQSLIPISSNTESTDIISTSEFIAKVKAYQKSHSDTLSGGNGLE